jgi:hypothetical protein
MEAGQVIIALMQILDGFMPGGVCQSRAILAAALNHPRLQGVPRWNAITAVAQELFTPAGFSAIVTPERHMERLVCASHKAPAMSKVSDKKICLVHNQQSSTNTPRSTFDNIGYSH